MIQNLGVFVRKYYYKRSHKDSRNDSVVRRWFAYFDDKPQLIPKCNWITDDLLMLLHYSINAICHSVNKTFIVMREQWDFIKIWPNLTISLCNPLLIIMQFPCSVTSNHWKLWLSNFLWYQGTCIFGKVLLFAMLLVYHVIWLREIILFSRHSYEPIFRTDWCRWKRRLISASI